MALRTPLILNQSTARLEELAVGDQISGNMIAGFAGNNALINGAFGLWQRGNSRTLNAPLATYVADRWQGVCGGPAGASMIMSQQSFLPSLDGALKYALFQVQNAVAGTDAFTCQLVEGVQTYAGKTTTVTLYGWANANNTLVGVRILQRFGTGGSADVETQIGTVVLNTTPGYVTITFDVPSIAGKILGTANACVYLILDFCKASGYSGQLVAKSPTIALSMVKWEPGAASTSFFHRDPTFEQFLAMRYFEKSYDFDTVPGTATSVGQHAFFIYGLPSSTYSAGKEIAFKVPKRVPPAMTGYSPQTGAAGKAFSAAPSADIPIAFQDIGTGATFCTLGPVATGTINLNYRYHWTADSELF